MTSLPSLAELEALRARLATELDKRKRRNKLAAYSPYAKQEEFHAAGLWSRERLLMAGNQLGKTFCGGAEAAIHLTGRYPDWWEGRRFDRPVNAWAGSVTAEVTRDNVQRIMVGPPANEEAWGEGAIPKECLGKISRRQGVANALDTVLVKHVSGGFSSIGFKSFDQGRTKWQGDTKDFVWFDEEPPLDVYTEGLTRTNAVSDGMVYMTFTPLMGMSDVVHMYLEDE